MKHKNLFLVVAVIFLSVSLMFFTKTYEELMNYSELSAVPWMITFITVAIILFVYIIISERTNVKRFRKQNEKRFQALVESYDAIIAIVDEQLTAFYRTPAAERLTGYSADDIEAKNLLSQIHPDDHGTLLEELAGLRTHPGARFLITLRLKHKHGHYIWLESVFTNLLEDPTIQGIVINMRDVTDRKKTEMELIYAHQEKETESRKAAAVQSMLAAIVNSSDDAIISKTVDGQISSWNRGAEKLFGYSEQEAINKHISLIVPTDRIDEEIMIARRLSQSKDIEHLETERVKKDGNRISISLTVSPLMDPTGTITGFSKIARDITERKKAEGKLEVSEFQYRSLIEQASDAIFIANDEGRYIDVNTSACTLLNYSREELLMLSSKDIVYTQEGIRNLPQRFESLRQGTSRITENQLKRKDGSPVDVEVNARMLSDGRFVGIVRDISERKNTALKLAQTLKEVSDYKFALNEACIVAITDQKGMIRYANDNFCAISKYSREELIGQDHRIVNSGYHTKEFIKSIWTTIANGKVWRNEIKNKAKDGTFYWVDTTIVPFLDDENKPYQYMAIRADITERKKAEENTIASEEKLRFVLDNMIEGIQIIGYDWRYQYLNNTALGHGDATRDQLTGYTMMEKYPGIEKTELFGVLKTAMTNRISQKLENKFEYANGSVAWYQLSIQPVPEGIFVLSVDITERKRVEEKLSASERRFRALIENMEDAIVLNDEASNLIYQSPSVTRILGYTPQDRIGRPVLSYVHPDFREAFLNLYETLRNHPSKPFPFQYQFLHKNGHYVWLEGVVTNLLKEEGVNAIVANYRDVSGRKEAEEKLQHERSLLRTVIDNLPDYIYVKDTQSRFLITNKADIALMNEDSEAAVIGKTAVDVFGPEIGEPFLEHDAEVIRTGLPLIDLEERHITNNGEQRFLLTTKVPLRDKTNAIIGLVGISRDITKQKQVELDIRNSNYFLELAQRVGKIGHWISDIINAENLIWSIETCRIFGIEPDQFDGKGATFFALVHPEDLARLQSKVTHAIENKCAFSLDHRIVLRDNTQKWVHVEGEPTLDEHGNAVNVVGIVQDITQRKRIENEIFKLNQELEERVKLRTEQLMAANKEMEAFTYSVSHDLRSPLRIIDGYAQILIEDYVSTLDEEGQKILGIIMTNAKKMGQLIDDLLNFSQIGRIKIRQIQFDLNILVHEVLDELRQSGIDVPLNVTLHPLAPAKCDPSLIKLVFMNLLSNAIKYSSATSAPFVEVGMLTEEGKNIYFVRDNGAGFDMAYYNKLFGVFQRLHSHDEFSGTGVGLAIVQRIVVRHGGKVWAQAKVNEGATFFFSLE
jgi:PAS domain S-box-containing protein